MLTPRTLAWEILRSGSEMPMRRAHAVARRADLDRRDRALLTAILGAAVRRRGTLHALVRALAHKRPDPDLAAHVHVGLVQLLFLDHVPDHAAVDETVRGAQATLGPRAGRTANAMLRELLRWRAEGTCGDPRRDIPRTSWHLSRALFPDPGEHPLLWAEQALSMPVGLVRRWVNRYGQAQAFELAHRALVEADLSVRVRGARARSPADPVDLPATDAVHRAAEDASLAGGERAADADRAALLAELSAAGCAPRAARHADVILLPHGDSARVIASERFARGELTIQGETALRAAEFLEARAGERLLDLCAAPGGKTAVLAESGAHVLAYDKSASRLATLADTIARLTPRGTVEVLEPERTERLEPASFDGVLVDVPCSNTGVLAQRPGARWRYSNAATRSLDTVQSELLARGAACVRPGGRLVYATCSIEPDENRRRIDAFLAQHSEFALEATFDALPGEAGEAGPVDGGHAARLRRT